MEAKLLSLVVLFMFLSAGIIQTYAQDKPKSRTLQWKDSMTVLRAQSKKEQSLIDSLEHLKAAKALLEQDFVLEGDELVLKHGERGYVNSITNFVALHDGKATIQISPFYSDSGLNGIGGITVEGYASDIKFQKDKKGNVSFSMNVSGSAISTQITVRLAYGNSRATTTVNSNFNSMTITLNGNLVPFWKASVYKGNSL